MFGAIVQVYLALSSMMVRMHHGARRELVDHRFDLNSKHLQNATYDSADKDAKLELAKEVLAQLMDVDSRSSREDKIAAKAIKYFLSNNLEPSKAQLLDTICSYDSLTTEKQNELAEAVKQYLEDLKLFDICRWLTIRNLQRALEARDAAESFKDQTPERHKKIDEMGIQSSENCDLFRKVSELLGQDADIFDDIKNQLGVSASSPNKECIKKKIEGKKLFFSSWLTLPNLHDAIKEATKAINGSNITKITKTTNIITETSYSIQVQDPGKEVKVAVGETQDKDPVVEMKVAGPNFFFDKDSAHTLCTMAFWLVALYWL